MTMTAEQKANFASNLRHLCSRSSSIAAVCRGTGINRQQFNRYLAGQSLPNLENRRKICRYFRIAEEELFRADVGRKSRTRPQAPHALPWSKINAQPLLAALRSGSPASIEPGIYAAFFSQIRERRSVVRSTVIITNEGELTTFRRVTGLAERKGSWWGQFLGDHRGLVLERVHRLYFMGLNVVGVFEPSLMVMTWLPGARPMLGGFASINATTGHAPVAAVMVPVDGSLKSALRLAHAYSIDDPELDPLVLEALEDEAASLSSRTAWPSGTRRRSATAPQPSQARTSRRASSSTSPNR
jgi:transcriptional regulator with XRE-family HTH domain